MFIKRSDTEGWGNMNANVTLLIQPAYNVHFTIEQKLNNYFK